MSEPLLPELDCLPDISHRSNFWLEAIGIGLTLWDGSLEGKGDRWLRWCDQQGQVIPTGENWPYGNVNGQNKLKRERRHWQNAYEQWASIQMFRKD